MSWPPLYVGYIINYYRVITISSLDRGPMLEHSLNAIHRPWISSALTGPWVCCSRSSTAIIDWRWRLLVLPFEHGGLALKEAHLKPRLVPREALYFIR